MLYIIPTPIGNLEDITLRALRLLTEVDVILAEDTRTSKKLLNHYKITTPLKAYHAHNEHYILNNIISELEHGKNMALISDAGTPGVSDPGFLLVRACRQKEIEVQCLPGATAFIPALIASGLPSSTFHFEGFLPHKKGRQTRFQHLAQLECTFILYESPFRLVKCLADLMKHCGNDRQAAVAREISKIHEEVRCATLEQLWQHYSNSGTDKGEIVIVVQGASSKAM